MNQNVLTAYKSLKIIMQLINRNICSEYATIVMLDYCFF